MTDSSDHVFRPACHLPQIVDFLWRPACLTISRSVAALLGDEGSLLIQPEW